MLWFKLVTLWTGFLSRMLWFKLAALWMEFLSRLLWFKLVALWIEFLSWILWFKLVALWTEFLSWMLWFKLIACGHNFYYRYCDLHLSFWRHSFSFILKCSRSSLWKEMAWRCLICFIHPCLWKVLQGFYLTKMENA